MQYESLAHKALIINYRLNGEWGREVGSSLQPESPSLSRGITA